MQIDCFRACEFLFGRTYKRLLLPEDGKCLRVILLEDGETVHNAFFDRTFGDDRE
jgi:hypothetical protein